LREHQFASGEPARRRSKKKRGQVTLPRFPMLVANATNAWI